MEVQYNHDYSDSNVAESLMKAGDRNLEDIAVHEHSEVSLAKTELSESFLVDIGNLSPKAIIDKPSASSIISVKMQRNLSRKGSPRVERNKTSSLASSGFTDGSPKANASDGGCDQDKFLTAKVSLGRKETLDKQPQQTIIITAENRCNSGKYLKRRTSFIDPKRVLFFFATLSSMGTMVLIYYTLSLWSFSELNSTQAQQ